MMTTLDNIPTYFTKLEKLFTTSRFSDLKLILDDGNHQEYAKVHKCIMWMTSPTNFFHDLLSKNENKNEIIVPVPDAYTAHDCIAYYFYEVTTNKGNLKPSEHITKFIQCCDMFRIPFDFSLDRDLQFTVTEFGALLNVICKMEYDKKYFRMIKTYFPNDYHFAIPRPDLYYYTMTYMFKECIAVVLDREHTLDIVDMEGNVLCCTLNLDVTLQICNKTKSVMCIEHGGKIVKLHTFDINKKHSYNKHIDRTYSFYTVTFLEYNENQCSEENLIQFLNPLANFIKSNCSDRPYYITNDELYHFPNHRCANLKIKQLNIKDFSKNVLVCTTKNNDRILIIDACKQIISAKTVNNITNCIFVSNKVVVFTTETSIKFWNFENDECGILGCHDNKILCINLIAENVVVTCDSELVVKIWNVGEVGMLYCLQNIPKLYLERTKTNIVGVLTKKLLDRVSE